VNRVKLRPTSIQKKEFIQHATSFGAEEFVVAEMNRRYFQQVLA
jgi:hypothetical protein